MSPKTALSILVVILVATGGIAPSLAATVTEDSQAQQTAAPEWDVLVQDDADEEQLLFAAPSPGPNGDFATIDTGDDGAGTLDLVLAEIDSGGHGINPGTHSDFDDVFRIENRLDNERTVSIVITSPDPNANLSMLRSVFGFYAGDDPATTIDGDGAVAIAPGESVSIGLTIDLTDADLAGESLDFAFVFAVSGDDGSVSATRVTDESNTDGTVRDDDTSDEDDSADSDDSPSSDATSTSDDAGGDGPSASSQSDPPPTTDASTAPAGSDTPGATTATADDDGQSDGEPGAVLAPTTLLTVTVVLVSGFSTLLAWRTGIGR